jgi:hypothetical protein
MHLLVDFLPFSLKFPFQFCSLDVSQHEGHCLLFSFWKWQSRNIWHTKECVHPFSLLLSSSRVMSKGMSCCDSSFQSSSPLAKKRGVSKQVKQGSISRKWGWKEEDTISNFEEDDAMIPGELIHRLPPVIKGSFSGQETTDILQWWKT